LARALLVAAPARGETTITMSGSVVTQALVADLAYFYRHDVRGPPRFVLSGGVTPTGIAASSAGSATPGSSPERSGPAIPPASC
jgi:hypothetical protein